MDTGKRRCHDRFKQTTKLSMISKKSETDNWITVRLIYMLIQIPAYTKIIPGSDEE